MIDIRAEQGAPGEVKIDLLILDWFVDSKTVSGNTAVCDHALGGLITDIAKDEQFTGKEGTSMSFRSLGKISATRVLVLGLGNRRAFTLEKMRRAAARATKYAQEVGAKTCVIGLPSPSVKLSPRDLGRAITEGFLLANYTFHKFKERPGKKEVKKPQLKSIMIRDVDARKVAALEEGIEEGMHSSRATMLARDLVNEPPMHLTPAAMAESAEGIVRDSKGAITIKTYGKAALERMKAGGILAVAKGSDHDPVLVHMIWSPRGATKKVALVGKAITFDSGGLSLKPSDGMITMKCDMAGAATVLGVFSVLTTLKPKVEVHGIFAACENMPSGGAYRPGDIVRTMSGKTIEVLNTDAEGRVTLADTLHYAVKLKPDYTIDLATLTGACVVALGEEVAGLMTNDHKLGEKLKTAAATSGEYIWELPLVEEYEELVMSKIADVKNVGGRWGGAITAGIFLEQFVDQATWAHLDIAGPAFAEHETIPYVPLGGTGFGVRTLLEFLAKL